MLFPDPNRRGEVDFVLLKFLPYNHRLGIMVGLLVVGFVVQVFGGLWWGGAPLLLAASLLAIVKGFSNVVGRTLGAREWRGADVTQLENIANIAQKARKWDQSLLDITCARGAVVFLVIGVTIVFTWWKLQMEGNAWLGNALALDAAVLLVPHWFTGVRRILVNAPLTIKVHELLHVYYLWEDNHADDEDMTGQMEIRKAPEGEVPTDAKLILKLPPLGDSFLGVQVQVTLNNVQGRDYPYTYCVMVARPELGMLEKLDPDPPAGIMVEMKRQEDVDIVIVRQRTTKTSGYDVSRATVARIFNFTREEVRKLL